jgi:hypothetical protein
MLNNGKFLSADCEHIQNALHLVQRWNGKLVSQKPELCKILDKYLEVILDLKLNWNSHIDHRLSKGTIIL